MAIARRKDAQGRKRYLVRINSYRPDGSRYWHTVGTFDTVKTAKAKEAAAIEQRERGTLLEPTKTTVRDLMESWLAYKAPSVTSNTLAEYRSNVATHILPALGSVRIQRLTTARIQDQYSSWVNAGHSARVIRSCHLRLSAAFEYAVQVHLIAVNPAKSAKPPRLARPRFDHWNPDEAKTFLRAVADYHAHWRSIQPDRHLVPAVLWDLLLREGMRRGEALGLRWRDINWQRGTAHIVQTVVADQMRRGASLIQERTKTKAGARTVHLTAEAIAAIEAQRFAWKRAKDASTAWQDTDLIVCTADGGPVNPSNIDRSLDAIARLAGVKRIKVHELRHTCASLLLLAGIPAKVVSEKLGHSSIAMTLDVYSHLAPSMQEDAAEAMSRILA